MKFVIKVGSLYYLDASYCWTSKITEAKQWDDRSIPEKIIAYWQKVHYENDPKKGSTALCGQSVLSAEIVDV